MISPEAERRNYKLIMYIGTIAVVLIFVLIAVLIILYPEGSGELRYWMP